ncbi:MAG: substrate-binding domain-containing protein [Chloroflexi bacterium]|nr:substrate-binding domain-containing protein [Chloroflexota bacterium]
MSKPVDPFRRLCLYAPLMLTLAACNRARVTTSVPMESPVRVRVAVDSAIEPLMRALAQSWQRMRPSWSFVIEQGNAAVVNQIVNAGGIDFAAVAVLPDAATSKLWIADLALDGIAVIVHASNTVSDISLEDLLQIYAGYRHEWSSLGDQTLGGTQVVVRETGDDSRLLFDQQVMAGTPCISSAIVMPTPETAVNYVVLHPDAIAYVASGFLVHAAQPLVKAVRLGGIAADAAAFADGSYPLSRDLHLIAPQEPVGALREFVNWIYSQEAREIITSHGYATIS